MHRANSSEPRQSEAASTAAAVLSRQYVPGRAQLGVWLVVAAVAVVALWQGQLTLWWMLLAILTPLSVVDALRLARLPVPELRRELDLHWPVQRWRDVHLRILNAAGPMQLYDWHPQSTRSRGLPLRWQPPSAPLSDVADEDAAWTVSYQVLASQRGRYEFPYCDVVQRSPWGWWQRRARLDLNNPIQVYPDYAELRLFLLLGQRQQLDQLGIHQFARRGQGGDFHQLRDYRAGDSLRQVDWKASARNQRLISREYQEDRDQQVLFLLDCGRRMGHRGDGRSHLDDALDAMLLLAFAALRQGDAVGMMSFGGEARWCAPRKGAETINALLQLSYDLQAQPLATDYLAIAQQVLRRQRRRSLIVLLTNTRDEDYAELLQAARLLRRKHLVIIADLREELLDRSLASVPGQLDDALRYFAAADYLASRQQAHQQLGHSGVELLDVLPHQLAAALVNEYQRLKRSGQLAV